MLRRLASLGHQASDDSMSPSPGDGGSVATGGLAGVFKGLAAGGKLTKSPPPALQSPSIAAASSQPPPPAERPERPDAVSLSSVMRWLPSDQMEALARLQDGTPTERLEAATALRLAIPNFLSNPVIGIWAAGRDLIDATNPPNLRHAGWALLIACVKHPSSSDTDRREYFQAINGQAHPDDFHLRLAALEDLTNNGRNIAGFYHEIYPLLAGWLYECYKASKSARRQAARSTSRAAVSLGADRNFAGVFALLIHLIRFNFKYASDNVLESLVDVFGRICTSTNVEDDLRSCIKVIDALVTFGIIPEDKLKNCVQLLGSIHSLVPKLQKDSWQTVGNILKSHHGQHAVRILLNVLRAYTAPSSVPREESLGWESRELEDAREIKDLREVRAIKGGKGIREGKEGREVKETVREARGALSLLTKLLTKSTEKGYPTIPLSLLIQGLGITATRTNSSKVAAAVLKTVNTLFEGPTGAVHSSIVEERWADIFLVVIACSKRAATLTTTDTESSVATLRPRESREEHQHPDENPNAQLKFLISRIENLLAQKGADLLQRDECMEFLIEVAPSLPDSAASLLIRYWKEFRCCFPSDLNWERNLKLLLDQFFSERTRLPLTRIQALEIVVDVYNFLCLADGLADEDTVLGIVERVLQEAAEETDILVLQETVSFLLDVAEAADAELFSRIMTGLKTVITKDMARSPLPLLSALKSSSSPAPGQAGYVGNQSLSNVVTRAFVQLFIRTMDKDGPKAVRAYTELLAIVRSGSIEADARLTAMKMLFRLRADIDHRVYLTTRTENESLAGSLYRTEASLARRLAEDAAQPPRPSRTEQVGSRVTRGISFTQGQAGERASTSRSAPKLTMHQGQRLWSVPDPDALPEPPPDMPSYMLFTALADEAAAGTSGDGRAVLPMGLWLNVLKHLFLHGCEWEVYSFILAHLPSQLSNHPVFEGAISPILDFRRVLCEMLRATPGLTVQDPPSSSGLRRIDVANCLFHSLIVIMSYRQYFQKPEEDDIVRTFMNGIADKTARTCIHALSICCHELPLSLSKNLVTILVKMSQVITQQFVAMHILEFLACLSRLPSLYSNFREEEYRIVFGICIRYLQHVREKKHAARSSHSSEPSTPSIAASQLDALGSQPPPDDLPQYVYALAYHVITFWFLAVKLPDRPSYIPWVSKGIFTDVDGKPNNEDQAQITLDFMQRVAFSDACDSAQDPLFNEENFGEIHQKLWILGNSIVTIRQAMQAGWAEITRRYPSGTSSYMIRVEFTPMQLPPTTEGPETAAYEGRFQQGVTIFPSHLLMQLLAPMPQIHDASLRPIPLPDDEAVSRAIRSFDLNSTVDGHKVGVIYIGDGQTKETDILANTIGSPDYHEFLTGLGVLTRLKGATFNTQGLDRVGDSDGQFTYCWRDRVTEIVFHVTTQMPTNLEHDPQCILKKRHIGNDFVSIIWNDSGLPFQFDTFPSDFNYVYIVITPTPRPSFMVSREMARKRQAEGGPSPYFTVQVMSKPGFPEISPAAEPKMISLKALPGFVRLLALNASVFSHVWRNRDGGEHVSSWRNRLVEINRLRERYGKHATAIHPLLNHPGPSPPGSTMGVQNSQQQQQQQHHGLGGQSSAVAGGPEVSGASRPPSGVRDSFSSLRRSSVATFFTSASTDMASHRSSMLSTTTTDNTEVAGWGVGGADQLVEAVDFSKWT